MISTIVCLPSSQVNAKTNDFEYILEKNRPVLYSYEEGKQDIDYYSNDTVQSFDGKVSFIIPSDGVFKGVDIRVAYRYYYATYNPRHYYYTEYSNLNSDILIGDAGWQIDLYGFDWSKGTYYISISTATSVYYATIDKRQDSALINLEKDESYLQLDIDIEGIDANTDDSVILITNIDENGRPVLSNYINQDIYIPSGTYALQINSEQSNEAYYILTGHVELTPKNNSITYTHDDLTKIELDNSILEELRELVIDNIIFIAATSEPYTTYYGLGVLSRKTKECNPIYVRKAFYNRINFGIGTGFGMKKYNIYYTKEEIDLKNTNSYTYEMSLNHRANISLENSKFKPGEFIDIEDAFLLYDDFNNSLEISVPYTGRIKGLLEVRKDGKLIEESLLETYGKYTLPEIPGEYELLYRGPDDFPLNITPDSKIITIVAVEPIDLTKLRGGGKTIIIETVAYHIEYLKYNPAKFLIALITGSDMFVKLTNDIYIDNEGNLVNAIDLPQVTEYIRP